MGAVKKRDWAAFLRRPKLRLRRRLHLRPAKKKDDGISPRALGHQQVYWWIWGVEHGRRIVWGPYESDSEAYAKGYSKLSGKFEVVPLRTRDTAEASRILRARLFEETGDIDETFKYFRHKE